MENKVAGEKCPKIVTYKSYVNVFLIPLMTIPNNKQLTQCRKGCDIVGQLYSNDSLVDFSGN